MVAKFYNCTRDDRYLFKLKASDLQYTANIEILTSNDMIRPKIRVDSGILTKSVNYCWLKDTKRFYYLRKPIMENGYITFELECDVLMSHRMELMNTPVMVKRNEFKYNAYINDDKMKLLAPTAAKIKADWDSPFDETGAYFYLALVSSQGSDGGE